MLYCSLHTSEISSILFIFYLVWNVSIPHLPLRFSKRVLFLWSIPNLPSSLHSGWVTCPIPWYPRNITIVEISTLHYDGLVMNLSYPQSCELLQSKDEFSSILRFPNALHNKWQWADSISLLTYFLYMGGKISWF